MRHINHSVIVSLLAIIAVGFAQFMPTANAQTPLHFGWSSVTPHTADYDGDQHMEMGLYDSARGAMYARKLNGEELAFDLSIALPSFIAACADFDGDGKADPASYDLTGGVLYAFLSARGYQLSALPCAVGASTTKAVPADYDGDHKADPALYDSASGAWIIFLSTSGYQPVSFILGGNGATAVPMDYDGDGKNDPCVYDQNTGLWMMLCSASQYAPAYVVYGGPGCVAAPADFDGDHKADPTVYCSALGVWGTLNSASNYAPNVIIQGGVNCTPIPGNYYFTNRADYALYNTTNRCWTIAYDHHVNSLAMSVACKWLLKNLFKGSVSGMVSGSVGFGLRDIFNHGQNPSDPHWAEEQQMLSEMNQKLDDLLADQQVITNMLIQITQQLEYDMSQVEWDVESIAANDAISIIESHYDQYGMDGYRSFYECDTNNPPSCTDVDTFVNIVLGSTYNMKTAVDNIYRAIIPATGNNNTNGVLHLWANMVKPTLTPDNLLDNYSALADYFATMYNYQMKGANMYVDACRVHGTSAWAEAATDAWVTNDLMNMVQAEVDDFRAVTYDYIMTAVNAAYDPVSTNNPMEIAGVADTFASLEFFSRQWLGQTETLCATFLTIDQPDVIARYNNLVAYTCVSPVYEGAVQTVATNRWTGHPYYGHLNPDLQHLVVNNGYVFLRNDFGQVHPNGYTIRDSNFTILGQVGVFNYDDNMQPTSDPSVTNWFGHLYASPYNYDRLALPVADSSQWSRWTPSYFHYIGHYNVTTIADILPTSLTNFTLGMVLQYNWIFGKHNPAAVYGTNVTYAVYPQTSSTPIQVINSIPGSVNIRMDLCANNTAVLLNYDADDTHEQRYSLFDSGGSALLVQPSAVVTNTWLTESGIWTEPKSKGSYTDHHLWITNATQCKLNALLQASPGQTTTVTIAIGGGVSPKLDCFEGGSPIGCSETLSNQVSYSISYAILSFY